MLTVINIFDIKAIICDLFDMRYVAQAFVKYTYFWQKNEIIAPLQ